MKEFLTFLLTISCIVSVTGQNKTDFDKYISKFIHNKTNTINRTNLKAQKDDISANFIKRFITDKSDCECLNEGLWYRYMSKIELENFVITFVEKNCDTPSSSGSYPYSDVILMVYSPTGEIIDSKVIFRGGDLWQCNYHGTTTPFKFIVDQARVSKK